MHRRKFIAGLMASAALPMALPAGAKPLARFGVDMAASRDMTSLAVVSYETWGNTVIETVRQLPPAASLTIEPALLITPDARFVVI